MRDSHQRADVPHFVKGQLGLVDQIHLLDMHASLPQAVQRLTVSEPAVEAVHLKCMRSKGYTGEIQTVAAAVAA